MKPGDHDQMAIALCSALAYLNNCMVCVDDLPQWGEVRQKIADAIPWKTAEAKERALEKKG